MFVEVLGLQRCVFTLTFGRQAKPLSSALEEKEAQDRELSELAGTSLH